MHFIDILDGTVLFKKAPSSCQVRKQIIPNLISLYTNISNNFNRGLESRHQIPESKNLIGMKH